MTLLHSEREREGERGTEIPMKLKHRPQSIHSSYIIFNLYTMILSPNQTSPKPRHRVVPAEKINQRGGNNEGWGSWSIIAAAAAAGAVAVVLFCWR